MTGDSEDARRGVYAHRSEIAARLLEMERRPGLDSDDRETLRVAALIVSETDVERIGIVHPHREDFHAGDRR